MKVAIRLTLQMILVLTSVATVVACSKSDTESQVSSGNEDLHQLNPIAAKMYVKGIDFTEYADSVQTLKTKSYDENVAIRDLLADYIRRASHVIAVAERKDVTFSADSLDQIRTRLEAAKKLKQYLDSRLK